jgi:hypothetical protein
MTHRLLHRVITPITVLLVFTLSAGAQMAPVEKVDLEMIKKIRTEGLEHSQVMETLSYLTDVIGPRLTGSPGMKHANEWTKEQLTSWGLQNAHLEPWGPFGRAGRWSDSRRRYSSRCRFR